MAFMRIQVHSFQEVEFKVIAFYPDYVSDMQLKISKHFRQIAENADGCFQQENIIVKKYMAKQKCEFQTSLAKDAYFYMENFAQSVHGQLFRDRLLEVFIELVNGLTDHVERLQIMSETDVQEPKQVEGLPCYVKMVIRLNDLQTVYTGLETFKVMCLEMQHEQMHSRTEQLFKQRDQKLLNSRDSIVHSLALYIIRHSIEKVVIRPLFSKSWLYPDNDQCNPVYDALFKHCASFLNEIFRNLEFDGTKQKIFDQLFTLMVDAYIDRFIVSANHMLKLKRFQSFGGQEARCFTLSTLAQEKSFKITPIDFTQIVNDEDKLDQFCDRVQTDMQNCFYKFGEHSIQGIRVSQNVVNFKLSQLMAFYNTIYKIATSEQTAFDEEWTSRMNLDFRQDSYNQNSSMEYQQQIQLDMQPSEEVAINSHIDIESFSIRLNHLQVIFTELLKRREVKKQLKVKGEKKIKLLNKLSLNFSSRKKQ